MPISKWFLVPLFLAILTVGVVNIYRNYSNVDYTWVWYDVSCIVTGILGIVFITVTGYLEKRNENKIKV